MRSGLIILGLGLIFFSLIIIGETDGELFFFGMIIVGLIFIFKGLKGSRTFQCPKCNKNFDTRDKIQQHFFSCPYCSERYYLEGNKIYNVATYEELLNMTEDKRCPECNARMLVNLTDERWTCSGCNRSLAL